MLLNRPLYWIISVQAWSKNDYKCLRIIVFRSLTLLNCESAVTSIKSSTKAVAEMRASGNFKLNNFRTSTVFSAILWSIQCILAKPKKLLIISVSCWEIDFQHNNSILVIIDMFKDFWMVLSTKLMSFSDSLAFRK